MSTERLNRNFQKFLQTIYHWPTSTIEKSTLIQKLEELCRQNPELQHIYENVPITGIYDPSLNDDTADQSRLETTETYFNPSTVEDDVKPVNDNSHQLDTTRKHIPRKESNPSLNIISVKEGDLTVRKGSAILSPLLKKNGFKSSVYCELSYAFSESEKFIYLIIYQSRKCRKLIHKFIIDSTCSFVYESKRDFKFKHNAVGEKFTTETGIANTWISSFNEILVRQKADDEDIYENPYDLSSGSDSANEYILETPSRPPPRPPLPTNPISPENIYVCLYDHFSTTNDSQELEFNCGDLLYIINTDGPNFYVGHRLILPLNSHNDTPKGLVFKDYVQPAYEKVL